MKIDVKITGNMKQVFQHMKDELRELPENAYKEFVKNTPVRNGYARRNTRLKNKSIQADYPYAGKLDQGYSKQSPDGMTNPTEQFIEKEFIKIMTGKR
jgi:hypothetical protein